MKLYGSKEPLQWLHEDLSSDRNQGVYAYLTNELGIGVVAPSNIAQLLNAEFLEDQSDDWMKRFYAFLQDQEALWREGTRWKDPGPLRNKAIIRIEDNSQVAPFTADDQPRAYLPGEHKSYFPTVKKVIASDKDALEFLRRLGLRKPDSAAEVIEYVLPRYTATAAWHKEDEGMQRDLKLIVDAWRTDSTKAKDRLREQLRTSSFVPCRNPASGERFLATPLESYFRSVDLETYFTGNESVRFVETVMPPDAQEVFDKLLGELGVAREPRRVEFDPNLSWEERSRLRGSAGITHWRGETLKDYDLDGLDLCLENITNLPFEQAAVHSKVLWCYLCRHQNEPRWFNGSYSWFHYNPWSVEFPASFLKKLNESAWLPRRDEQLCKPADLFLKDLPSDFQSGLKLADMLGMPSEQLAEIAAHLQVDEEAILLLREHPDELREFVRSLQRAKEEPTAKETAASLQAVGGNSLQDGEGANPVEPSSEPPEGVPENQKGESTSVETAAPREPSSRLPVIVASGGSGSPQLDVGIGPDMEVARAGVLKALQYEVGHDREPEEMPHSNEGFDIRSYDPVKKVTRLIEVKSTSGDWGDANIALSGPQFRFGMRLEQGHEYWLYVVEQAGQPTARIHCVPDPVRQATDLIYPSGWRKLAITS